MMSPEAVGATIHNHAEEQHKAKEPENTVEEQTVCPVMGGEINKEYFIVHEGKRVYFCCPGCEEQFLKEPEKYLDKLPQFKR